MNSNPTSMINGDLIKHDRFMDVAIALTQRPVLTENGIHIHGLWYNLGHNQTFCIGETTFLRFDDYTINPFIIPIAALADGLWKKCVDPDWRKEGLFGKCSKSYRHSQWETVIVSDSLVKNS